MSALVKCESCNGTGSLQYRRIDQPHECGTCGGTGTTYAPTKTYRYEAVALPHLDDEKRLIEHLNAMGSIGSRFVCFLLSGHGLFEREMDKS